MPSERCVGARRLRATGDPLEFVQTTDPLRLTLFKSARIPALLSTRTREREIHWVGGLVQSLKTGRFVSAEMKISDTYGPTAGEAGRSLDAASRCGSRSIRAVVGEKRRSGRPLDQQISQPPGCSRGTSTTV